MSSNTKNIKTVYFDHFDIILIKKNLVTASYSCFGKSVVLPDWFEKVPGTTLFLRVRLDLYIVTVLLFA